MDPKMTTGGKADDPPAYSSTPQQPQPSYHGGYTQQQDPYSQSNYGGYYQQNPQMGYYPQQGGGYPGQQYPPQQGGYYGGQPGYGPPGGYYPQGHYQDQRSGPGFAQALLASLACCCCLDCLLF